MWRIACLCGRKLRLPGQHLGRAVLCPGCRGILRPLCAGGEVGGFEHRLVIESGPERAGEQLLLGGEEPIHVGSGKTVHLMADAAHEVRLMRTIRGGFVVEPVKVGAGVMVNEKYLPWKELKEGDRLQVGDYVLAYCVCGEEVIDLSAQEEDRNADGTYGVSHEERWLKEGSVPEVVAPASAGSPVPVIPISGPTCPSCGKTLGAGSIICVACGIDLKTGRGIAISRGLDEEAVSERAGLIIRGLSWIMPIGVTPVASEAFATQRPVATWIILALTVMVSSWFMQYAWEWREPTVAQENLMQWSGSRAASQKKIDELRKQVASIKQEARKDRIERKENGVPIDIDEEYPDVAKAEQMVNLIEKKLLPAGVGFRWWQPVTTAFLHGGIFHLAGNMLFLLIFGLRVNELVGNSRMMILYPILALAAGLSDHLVRQHQPLGAMVGASGAIMGLAGMYFIFFPVQKVFMIAWVRPIILFYKVFRMRGFWLLLLWIVINDLVPMALGKRDFVAHWAHLGGFVFGMGVALFLLMSRQVSARGSDLLTVALGRRAWALVGRPAVEQPRVRAISLSMPE